ncbi:MAG: pyridoxamine 5'-phosphate oxidase family protein [Rhodobacteraceae bacterium]|nr:pyridoxamine 5'-phosphate oxidase family protein [Paracoccaceae bacterium]
MTNSSAASLSLETLRPEIWASLAAAASDRAAPFRTPVLATVAPDGAPRARVVVLRKAAPDAARLEIHTDNRSAKFSALTHEPRAELTFWDPARQWQIRAAGRVEILTEGADADLAWAAVPDASRRNYGDSAAPGTRLRTLNPHAFPATPPDADPDARAAFALLRLHVSHIDWLHLAPGGHRRAQLHWSDDGVPGEAYWVAP